jgi:glycine betaine/proline transport system substrate-binding protein
MRHVVTSFAAFALLPGALSAVSAAEPESCKSVQMADPGWTDITSTNAMAGIVLNALGYEQKVSKLSVPMTFVGLQKDQVDVFLGNWMPAQKDAVEPLLKDNKIQVLRDNLPNAKFTLAVPDYVAAAGVKSFSDLAKFAPKFEKKIYGIDPGSPANQNIRRMLDAKSYGLEGWSLVESGEQGMLTQVARKARNKDWIVFLAWEPHQMNVKFNLTYLDGDKEYFGPNFGNAMVRTLARKGFAAQCPNVAKLFSQLVFTVDMENKLITDVLEQKKDVKAAATEQLKAHPELLGDWLAGVSSRTGEDGLAAVRKALAAH